MEIDVDRSESMVVDSPPAGASNNDSGINSVSNEQLEEEGFSEHARPRKRTRRACDKCSASRTRCNGECPCRRCEDYGYTCRYNREVKKRGRVPISVTGGGSGGTSETNISHHHLERRRTGSREDCHSTHNHNQSSHRAGSFSNCNSNRHYGGPATTPSPSIASPPGSLGGGGGDQRGDTGRGGGLGGTVSDPRASSHFAQPQRSHSYSDSAVAGGRPHLHTTNSNNGLARGHGHGYATPGLTLSTGPMLPGISTVPGPPPLPAPSPSPSTHHHPAYVSSPGASGSYSAGGVHSHMQLASLLDPTATLDNQHPGAGPAFVPPSHHHQTGAAVLPRIAPHQNHHLGGSPPASMPPSTSQPLDMPMSDDSAGYPSPAGGGGSLPGGVGGHHQPSGRRVSFGAGVGAMGLPGMRPRLQEHHSGGSIHGHGGRSQNRGSFSTSTTTTTTTTTTGGGGGGGEAGSLPELQRVASLYKAPSADCRYRCLVPVLPYIGDIIPASVACDLLDVYLTEPGSSLFRCASPYILTRIFRKKSLLHPTNPRPTTPALLATMLWCAAQTADIVLLHVPGSRSKICNALYELSTALISERDPDRWRRIHGGLRVENEQQQQNPYAPPYVVPSPDSGRGDLRHHHHQHQPATTATNEPAGLVDDVLTFILLSIAVSGGDFKSDCFKWWSKAVRLALALGLNREDERCSASVSPCPNPLCSCRRDQEASPTLAGAEAREERRRVFWLLYCLDRHLALSFNSVLYIPDSYCEVYSPLPEGVWEDLDAVFPRDMPERVIGPPIVVSGTGFFEYFLPLMAILGDIIEVHHRRQHPRLGGIDDAHAVALIGGQLASCERSLDRLAREVELLELSTSAGTIVTTSDYVGAATTTATSAVTEGGVAAPCPAVVATAATVSTPGPHIKDLVTGSVPQTAPSPSIAAPVAHHHHNQGANEPSPSSGEHPPPRPATTTAADGSTAALTTTTAPTQQHQPPRRFRPSTRDRSRLQLVTAYSTHILHVLHVLLHGKWDAISMLDDDDDWITSARFNDCASRAIAASQAVSRILKHDPELTFMPYLFGIYLLHGSFILLLFADRMPALGGPNQSVEQACETIVRAHEVCVVTLSTEFQKNFRKVLRSTLYSVRGSSPTEWEEHKARRRALSLYRWTRGAKGLAL